LGLLGKPGLDPQNSAWRRVGEVAKGVGLTWMTKRGPSEIQHSQLPGVRGVCGGYRSYS
jgi:hypothetical protein